MKKLNEIEKQSLIRKAHKLIDRLEENLKFIVKEITKHKKKAA